MKCVYLCYLYYLLHLLTLAHKINNMIEIQVYNFFYIKAAI